jgi:nitroreductase
MQLIEGIQSRRSIRKFTEQEISREDIQEIVTCGMYAPCAMNQQGWEFWVVQNGEKKTFLGEHLKEGRNKAMIDNANAVIITGFSPNTLHAPHLIQQDMGACVQNILLAAHDKGIGSVRIGVYPGTNQDHSLNIPLGIPEDVEIFNCILLGYPDTSVPLPPKDCVKPEKIHF